MKKGKIRNPFVVLLLITVTGGLYFIYWLIVNPMELKNAFEFKKGENQVKYTFVFMIVGALITSLFMLYTIVTSMQNEFSELHFYSTAYSLIMVIVGGLFFYFLCASTALAQKKAGLKPFEFLTVYGIYILNILIETGSDLHILSSDFFKTLPEKTTGNQIVDVSFITNLLPFMTLNGLVNVLSLLLFFFFIFLLQKQINTIWEEGNFDNEEIIPFL